MRSLNYLKDEEEFKGVSITDDYTATERKLLKEWSIKAKEKTKEESVNSKYVWKVRGTPKNGLRLKKVQREKLH